MRLRARFTVLFLVVPLAACDKLPGKAGKGEAAGADAAVVAVADAGARATSTGAAAKAADKAADGRVGDAPAWSPDKPTKPCAVSPAAKGKLGPLAKGDGAADLADVGKLVTDTGADACFATRKALAQALNDGGFKKYSEKKLDEAMRFWRAALVVRPSMVIARYNYACALALASRPAEAVLQVAELARVAPEEPAAQNFLEKAKSDEDLKSVRGDPAFQAALKASNGALVGPRKEPETAAKAVPLLPEEFRKVKPGSDTFPTVNGFVTYKPAVQSFWTWRPDGKTELLVATILDDPAKAGKPKGDFNMDYGAIAVFQRRGGDLALRFVRKTGESPPTAVAGGKAGTVTYAFEAPCGSLTGTLSWNGSAVETKEKSCSDL